jgi:hypothetical protein
MKRTNILVVAALLVLSLAPAAMAQSKMKTRVWTEATRLSALLHDAQTTVSVNETVWRTIGNEANALANKLYGHTAGNSAARALARDARMHVREFRAAALAGNATEARRHAAEALPFVNRLADWSAAK